MTLFALCFVAGCGNKDTQASEKPPIAAPANAPAAPPAVDLAGHRTAFDFLANRVHAVEHRGGRLIIAAGAPSFLKYVDGGWKGSWLLAQKDGPTSVAYVSGLSAAFSFPIDKDEAGVADGKPGDVQMTLQMKAMAPKQRVSLFCNEKPLVNLDVDQTWKSYNVVVPAATLEAGDNRIRLTFRASGNLPGGKHVAAALAGVEIGTPKTGDVAAEAAVRALGAATDVDLGGVRKAALAMPEAGRLSFYVQIPEKAKLALSYGSAAAGAGAAIRVARDGAAAAVLFEGPAAAGWTDGAWDLSAFAGQAVRIDLISRAGGVAWGVPRIVVQAPAAPAAQAGKFEHVFVWMCDTLRADKVRAFNPKSIVQTPNYDSFAADATRFAWAQVPGTWSLPSQAAMLTGVYPKVHKATVHESKISRDVPFVTELMKKGGFRTAIFSSNGYVSPKWGFGRGWDEDRNFIRESLPNSADYLWGVAKKWIVPNKAKPQFVYLAVVEPHVIYNPKKEFLKLYWDKPYNGPIKPVLTGIQLGKIKQGSLKVNDTDKAYLEALHNAEITQSDTAFGVFVQDLKDAGLYDTSAIIVISDHGDEFWDHGDCGHAQGPHQELVHVPFIVRAPGLLPAGKVVQTDVEAMDLSPTVLELAGLPVPETMQGMSALRVARDEVGFAPGAALTQNESTARGMKSGRYRFIHSGVAKMELFDEIEDPREQNSVTGKRPIALRQMRNVFSLLVAYENQWKKGVWGSPANVTEAFYREIQGKQPIAAE